MKYFNQEPGSQKYCEMLHDGSSSLIREAPSRLLHRLRVRPDKQGVLSQFPRDTLQIVIRPRKGIPILTEEVDDLAFLFVVQVAANDDLALRVAGVNSHLLGLLWCLE